MAQPPSTIRIGYAHLKVVQDERLQDHALAGQFNGNRMQIRYDPTHASKREVVLHECLHGIWDQTPLRNKDDHDLEEDVVSAFAPMLLGMLRDNPDLISWLLEDDHGS